MSDSLTLDTAEPFLFDVTIEPSDIDEQGHVNNAVYVRWMDRAAVAHSAALGYDWARYQQMQTAFVVRRHEVDYITPARLGDEVVVATWPTVMRRFTAHRRHQIVRRDDDQTLVRALTHWVYLDTATGRPTRMPAELIAAFGAHEE